MQQPSLFAPALQEYNTAHAGSAPRRTDSFSDFTLLQETGWKIDGGEPDATTMTLLEWTMRTMYDIDLADYELVRSDLLDQLAEGYFEIVTTNATPGEFERYRACCDPKLWNTFFAQARMLVFTHGRQTLVHADCLEWLANADAKSIDGVITDPPYGLREYQPDDVAKLRAGAGGTWRQPPAIGGCVRRPLPRFSDLSSDDKAALATFFERWGTALLPVLKPGAHVFLATNTLLAPIISCALDHAGFERRGQLIRLVRTMRGGDRPKGAEHEFASVCTTPRACYEPWLLVRRPLSESTVAANLRRWGVGALARTSDHTPFCDVIESEVTPQRERAIADHPSLKPQRLLRTLVDAALPLRQGHILDPFAGSASTLAACEARSTRGLGLERDRHYFELAQRAIAPLAALSMRKNAEKAS